MILRFTCVAALALPPLTNGRAHNPRSAFVAHAAAAAGYTGRIFHLPARHPSSPRRPSSPRTTSAPSMVATQTLPPLDSPAGARLKEEGVTQRDWAALLEAGGVDTLREGQLLISQGDVYEDPENREVYLLLQGECQIEVRGRPVGKMGPGEFVGEASFTSGRPAPRTASVRATSEDARVVAWTWGGLRAFLDKPGNLRTKAALQACWMEGLAVRLNDVMSAVGGQSVVEIAEEDEFKAGDYGYRYLEDMREVESIVPVSAFTLAWWTFAREYRALRRTFRFGEFKDTGIAGPFSLIDRFLETSVFPVLRPSRVDLPRDPEVAELQARLGELKLSNKAIEDRETARIAATKAFLEDESRKGVRDAGYILRSQTPWFVMVPYRALCWFLDAVFEDRPIQRFWFLETVARMPYFSYLSTLFLFETLGWWSGGAEVRKVHFAEEYNEMQHLRIMESLGGDTRWSDRFLARHAAVIYFFVLTLGYLVSPFLAYNFSELIESHAVDTYTEFAEVNKELLQSLPPTPQALDYYHGGDMYLFDEFQTSRPAFSRRPRIKNLYDVFRSVRDDEMEHVKTMFACERGKGSLTSPNAAAATPRWAQDAAPTPDAMSRATADNISRNKARRGSSSSSSSSSGGGGGGSKSNLRTDVVRMTPVEVFTSAFDPLRNLLAAAEKKQNDQGGGGGGGGAGKVRPPAASAASSGEHDDDDHGGVAPEGAGGAEGIAILSDSSGKSQSENHSENQSENHSKNQSENHSENQ